jgi:hypothetical protein
MHATLRRLRCAPGKASEVARLIEAEYVPQLKDVDGVVSYTLVDIGEDEISSLGVFESESAATTGNDIAVAWAKERLASLGAAPLSATEGVVLVHHQFDS